MLLARSEIWLATVHHRDRTVRQAFVTEHQARAWIADRRRAQHVVQFSVEKLWLSED